MRIMLACSAGMSTSLLVTKMEAAAKEKGLDIDIWAVPDASVAENWAKDPNIDVILLGPQIRFRLAATEKLVDGKVPVAVINMMDYGTMNGAKVLDTALETIANFKK